MRGYRGLLWVSSSYLSSVADTYSFFESWNRLQDNEIRLLKSWGCGMEDLWDYRGYGESDYDEWGWETLLDYYRNLRIFLSRKLVIPPFFTRSLRWKLTYRIIFHPIYRTDSIGEKLLFHFALVTKIRKRSRNYSNMSTTRRMSPELTEGLLRRLVRRIRISRAQDRREREKNRIQIIEFFKINGSETKSTGTTRRRLMDYRD